MDCVNTSALRSARDIQQDLDLEESFSPYAVGFQDESIMIEWQLAAASAFGEFRFVSRRNDVRSNRGSHSYGGLQDKRPEITQEVVSLQQGDTFPKSEVLDNAKSEI
jgi:hypothetical protein